MPAPDRERQSDLSDVAWYAASAMFAGIVAVAAATPLQRTWGTIAVWVYAAAALASLVLALLGIERRVVLAVIVMIGATVVPLALAAADRGPDDRGASAQSEVLIVEEGATALLDGHDPYAVAYLSGPLASRPLPTKTHVPYPPAMLAFGLPKAIAGAGPLTDARLGFLLVSLAVATAAVRAMRARPEDRLRSLQVLFVFPTGALLLATGGHDVPVLSVLLASFVLADRERADAAGAAAGVALAMRQTAVLAVPFVLATVPRGRRLRAAAWAAVPPAVIALPFVAWNPAAFVEDVVLFPLGLGTGRSSAQTPTIGSALVDLLPAARTPITIGLVVAIVASVVFLLVWRPSSTAAGAGARSAIAFAAAIALAPAARFGYVVYPISLAVWANAFRRGATPRDSRSASETSPAATGSRRRRRRRGRSRGSSAGTRRR